MSQEAQDLLKTYGVEIIEGEELNLEEAKAKIDEHYKTTLLENEDFIGSIPLDKLSNLDKVRADNTSEIYGKIRKKARGIFALTDEEMSEISDEEKSDLYKFLSRGQEIASKRNGHGNATAEKLLREKYEQQELIDQLKEQLENKPTEIEEKLRGEFKERELDWVIATDLNSVAKHLPATPKLLQKGITASIKTNYDIKDGEIFKKGTSFKVENPYKKGEFINSISELIRMEIGDEWIEPKATTTATTTTLITPIKGGKFNNNELAKKWSAE